MRYRVTAPYVTLRLASDNGGWAGRGFHLDALLPEGSHPDDVAKLLRKGMIAELDIPAPAPEPVSEPEPDPAPKPAPKPKAGA